MDSRARTAKLWMQSKRCAPGMGHMGHACLASRAGIGAAGARHEGTEACAVHKHGRAWHQGPEGQEHSGHCWVHQHGNRGQLTSGARFEGKGCKRIGQACRARHEGLERQENMGIPGYINTARGHWEQGRGDMRSAQQSTDSHDARKASHLCSLYAWGTWGMYGREAELGFALWVRGTRAQGHRL